MNAQPEVAEALRPALEKLEQLRGRAVGIRLAPEGIDSLFDHFRTVQAEEVWASLGGWVEADRSRASGPASRERFAAAKATDAAVAGPGRAFRRLLQARIRPLLAGGAVLVYPTSPCPAPLLTAEQAEQDAVRQATIGVTAIAGFCGLPEVTLPAGVGERRAGRAFAGRRRRPRSRIAGVCLRRGGRAWTAGLTAAECARRRWRYATATEADIPEIQSIYAHHVLTGTGTFEEEPPSVEEMAERFAKVVDARLVLAGGDRRDRRAGLRLLHAVPRPFGLSLLRRGQRLCARGCARPGRRQGAGGAADRGRHRRAACAR